MSSKKLPAYRGRLSPSQIAAGMNAASENARRLQEDAQVLLNAGRAPSAASLAALSIEESGKVSILRQLATATSSEEVASVWKSYRSHTHKNAQWLLPELASKGATKLEDFRPLFDEGAEHPALLDHVKQLGFYTDCLGNQHWSVPAEVVDAELASSLVQIAKLFVAKRTVTTQEVELWIEHVGAAPKNDLVAMKQALCTWYLAMQQAGLISSGPNAMERFIHEGVPAATSNPSLQPTASGGG